MKTINKKAFSMIKSNMVNINNYFQLLEILENETGTYYTEFESESIAIETGVQEILIRAKYALSLKNMQNIEMESLNVDTLVNLALFATVDDILTDIIQTTDINYGITRATFDALNDLEKSYSFN